MTRRSISYAVLAIAFAVALTACATPPESAPSPWAGSSPAETKPLVVALCHGENQTWPVNIPKEYFDYMFTETEGSVTIADYWRDVSHGRFSIEGSLVLDVQLDQNRDVMGDRNDGDFGVCRDRVDDLYDIDWDVYAGPVVIKPQTTGETVNAIDADDTQVQVRTTGYNEMDDWPAAPFTLVITKNGSLWKDAAENIENVLVTAVAKDYDSNIITFTIEREQPGYRRNRTDKPYVTPQAKPFESGTIVRDISDTYGSQNRTAVVSAHADPAVINQELGHFLGFAHSRRFTTPGSAYGDCFDVMSTRTCPSHYFSLPYDYEGGSLDMVSGPGMTSIYLDINSWIESSESAVFCEESISYGVRALGIPGSEIQQIRVPIEYEISDGVMAEYITAELRSRQFAWDQGIPRDGFVLHVKGDNGIAYIINEEAAGGQQGLVSGDSYEFEGDPDNPLDNRIFRVNDIDEGSGTGSITVSNPGWTPELLEECRTFARATPGGPETDGDGDPDDPDPVTTTTTEPSDLEGAACVPGTYELDSQAFIEELAAASGAEALPSEFAFAGGNYTLTITEDGRFRSVRDAWGFSIVTSEGSVTFLFDTVEEGTVSWDDGGSMTYAETVVRSQDDITIIVESQGFEQVFRPGDFGAPQAPAADALAAGTASYTCSADSLVIVPDDGPITITWFRTG